MKNILIVDDSFNNREMLKKFLLERIFTNKAELPTLFFSEDYHSTREELKNNKFDIVLLDAHLGDLEEDEEFSYKLIPEIKTNNDKVLIIMCSSNSAWNEAGIREGANTSINKVQISHSDLFPEDKIVELKNILK